MNIGFKIKQLLEEKNASQQDLANACGVSQPMVAMIINGRKIPGIALTVCIADFFGCSVDSLLREETARAQKGCK